MNINEVNLIICPIKNGSSFRAAVFYWANDQLYIPLLAI